MKMAVNGELAGNVLPKDINRGDLSKIVLLRRTVPSKN